MIQEAGEAPNLVIPEGVINPSVPVYVSRGVARQEYWRNNDKDGWKAKDEWEENNQGKVKADQEKEGDLHTEQGESDAEGQWRRPVKHEVETDVIHQPGGKWITSGNGSHFLQDLCPSEVLPPLPKEATSAVFSLCNDEEIGRFC